jgi:hypothetical protein
LFNSYYLFQLLLVLTATVAFSAPAPQLSSFRDRLSNIQSLLRDSNQEDTSLPLLTSLTSLVQGHSDEEASDEEDDDSSLNLQDTLGAIGQLFDSYDDLPSLSSLIGSNDKEDGSTSNTRETLGNIPVIGQLFDSSNEQASSLPSLPSLPSRFQVLRLISRTL